MPPLRRKTPAAAVTTVRTGVRTLPALSVGVAAAAAGWSVGMTALDHPWLSWIVGYAPPCIPSLINLS
ncbi:MAG: hypothetical protein FWH14_01775 [Oscillospiraceae bacterium]|nr:hypothetical protein [Oscillospiraceae bacterium]